MTKTVYTIGHSTRKLDDFVTMLLSFQINTLVDVRAYPGSRWFPHFNKEKLRTALALHRIEYVHLKDLGGRRDADAKSEDKRAKKNSAFDGYALYMKTELYKSALAELEVLAQQKAVAFMCAEADWRKCHRSLMADGLVETGWNVAHITGVEQSEPHAFTKYADQNNNLF
ncbi:MAG TPA: DUF488 domain-containing protein [Chitinophagales bacterium]|nr:DUF488 domain-containing protein [Chitinophagales bacterium]